MFYLSQFSVNVYNPLARPVSWPVRLPVNGKAYMVTDANGKSVDSQVGAWIIQQSCQIAHVLKWIVFWLCFRIFYNMYVEKKHKGVCAKSKPVSVLGGFSVQRHSAGEKEAGLCC